MFTKAHVSLNPQTSIEHISEFTRKLATPP